MQNLIFCVHNVVVDTLILDFFSFSLINVFSKTLEILIFSMACLRMPRSMSDNLKIQILKSNHCCQSNHRCQKLEVRYFRYIICVGQI